MIKSKKTLFTLPFAGGNRYSFSKFDNYLKDDFTIYNLELAGRGDRVSQDLMSDIYEIRDDLFNQIKDNINGEYIIYGHSLGGLLAYLIALKIEDKNLPLPSKLVISGRANPSMKPKVIRHNLPKESFIDSIKKLGGMPDEFFNHPELFDFFEPILRADFQSVEDFDFKESRKIGSKISVLYGSDEYFSRKKALKWKNYTHQDIDFKEFSGGHFFIFEHIEDVCNIIKED